MSEEQSKPLVVFLALLPIGLLLIIEFFAESLQSAEKLIPHLAFGVLIAQLLCLVAFIKGEICPGQRGRLIKANVCFALYWLVWLGMSLASPHHYVMTDIVRFYVDYLLYMQYGNNLRMRSLAVVFS